jgi:endonuclease III
MSDLTLGLLGRKPRLPHRKKWLEKFRVIADRLFAAHGLPTLGNYDDPVQEIFYIVLSAKTADVQYRRTHGLLTEKFSDLTSLANAPVKKIVRCIAGGGLANKKAGQVKRIASVLTADFGENLSNKMRQMSAQEAFKYLTELPGLGPKSALCVMMYSLDFDVFPVDANVSRIAHRLGVVRTGLKHYEYTQLLPAAVPPGHSKVLHIGLVVHGRTVCLPRNPRCKDCIIADLCKYGKSRLRGQKDVEKVEPTKKAKSS